jgi:hypothetical protein
MCLCSCRRSVDRVYNVTSLLCVHGPGLFVFRLLDVIDEHGMNIVLGTIGMKRWRPEWQEQGGIIKTLQRELALRSIQRAEKGKR